jgi:DNA polymerase-3 subunit alpha
LRLLDCINKVEDLIQYAFDLGLSGVCITDHEALSAHIKALKFYKAQCDKDKRWKDFKLGLGNEIYLCRNDLNADTYEKGEKFPHFILVAKDKEGHRQLRELSSRAWSHSFTMFLTRVPTYYKDIEEIVKPNPGHLIASSACIGGFLGICKSQNRENDAIKFVKWCQSIFGDDFYLELQPARYPEQIEYNKWLIQLGKETSTKCIVTTDSHYLKAEDREVHSSFLNSKDGDRETAEFYQYTYMMSPEEIKQLMGDYIDNDFIEKMFANTNEINSKIESYDLAQPQIVPLIQDDRDEIPWEKWLKHIKIQDKYEYLNKYLNSQYQDDRFFLFLGLNNLENLHLNKEKREQYIKRLEEEAAELWLVSQGIKQPLSRYLLTVRKIVNIIWEDAGSIVGPSRGSAGCLLFNYLIGITDMNPLEQGVDCPVWRFVYRDKVELSDIDVDSEGCRRNHILRILDQKMVEQQGRSLNVATFGTLGTRSAILTAARGLGIDIDEAQYLATMIPQERGFLWPLKDCIKGNKDKDRKPIKSLITEFKKYPGLLETCLHIEGLVCQVGIHASGVCLYNGNINEYSCSMKAPNGTNITQWDLHDAEYAGSLKFDLLSVEGADRIHKCLDLLVEDGYMEWQGSLRKTYVKYLHPDVLKRDGEDLWAKTWDGSIIDLFQLEGATGKQALSVIKPTSLPELAAINSLMRLMPDAGKKTPTEEYAYYKQHPQELKKEINSLEGTEKEKSVLYNFLKKYNGVCESQENIMMLSMIPEFAGFGYKDANALRKLISKKKMNEIPAFREKFIEAGIKNGCSAAIMNYLWDVQVHRQLGYSFSQIHTTAYSLIALQEMNLNYFYPPIYWATACLTVNSGGADEENGGTTNYGKLSSAIGRIKTQGIKVKLPDINKARFSFTPDKDTNSIIYGLKGISDVGDDVINNIIANRPYKSFQDFVEKVNPTKVQTLALIKAGCFDELEPISRKELLYNYLDTLIPRKTKLTLANVNGLINYNVLPKNKSKFIYLFNFNKYLKLNKKEDYYLLDERAYDYYNKNFDISLLVSKGKKTYIPIKTWDNLYKDGMTELKEYITKNQDKLISKLHEAEIGEVWQQYCDGTISTWEMDSLGFYYHDHELAQVYHPEFNFKNYFEMSSTPIPRETKEVKGHQIPIFDLEAICGTVVDKSSYKHTIVLLTPNGVVNVKCVAEHYSKYDKQISQINQETGRKEVIERSWFKRGTKLIVYGWRNGDQFMARGRQGENKYPFYKILGIGDTGLLDITRYRADD